MQLTPDQKDTLTELVNIGFSRAAASLSELTGNRIVLGVPEVSIHQMHELTRLLESLACSSFATVHQVFKGTISGDAVLLLHPEGAVRLVNLVSNLPVKPDDRLDESSREVLAEVGNILLSACLGVFGNMLNVRVSFSVPHVEFDAMDTMLQTLTVDSEELHYALVLKTVFQLCNSTIQGHIIIVLGVSSLDRLLEAVAQLYKEPIAGFDESK